MFINVAEELRTARKEGVALGAFNTCNLEVTKAICRAARKLNKPVIIQTTPKAISYAGLQQIFNIVKTEIENAGVRAAIHLDHATDFNIIKDCIDIGYRSVMVDGSKLSFAENVALTKKVVDYAKIKNVSVEGEIGAIKLSEDGSINKELLSSPGETKKFIELTGVDSVAISIGNQHGAPEGECLNLDLLKEISALIDIPIVLHGSSGLEASDIRSAIKEGIAKVNIDTKIRKAFMSCLAPSGANDYRDVLNSAMEKIEEVVISEVNILNNED